MNAKILKEVKILAYIIAEVRRQGHNPEAEEGAQRVIWMQEAWRDAQIEYKINSRLEEVNLKIWAFLIERNKNDSKSYRSCNVRVGYRVCPDWREVPRLMERWFENLSSMTPEEAYKELLLIHPWADGNGRTGKIVYNWLKGTLDDPVMPPSFFGCANP